MSVSFSVLEDEDCKITTSGFKDGCSDCRISFDNGLMVNAFTKFTFMKRIERRNKVSHDPGLLKWGPLRRLLTSSSNVSFGGMIEREEGRVFLSSVAISVVNVLHSIGAMVSRRSSLMVSIVVNFSLTGVVEKVDGHRGHLAVSSGYLLRVTTISGFFLGGVSGRDF